MRRRLATAVAGLVLLGLTACAPEPDYDPNTAEALQDQVRAISQLLADEDWPAADAQLAELMAATEAAHADGAIDDRRRNDILAAIALLDADLAGMEVAEPETTAEPEPAPVVEPTTPTDDDGPDDDREDDRSGPGGDKPGKDKGGKGKGKRP